jgi:hypothetical protein
MQISTLTIASTTNYVLSIRNSMNGPPLCAFCGSLRIQTSVSAVRIKGSRGPPTCGGSPLSLCPPRPGIRSTLLDRRPDRPRNGPTNANAMHGRTVVTQADAVLLAAWQMTHQTGELEVEWEDAVMSGHHSKRRSEGSQRTL